MDTSSYRMYVHNLEFNRKIKKGEMQMMEKYQDQANEYKKLQAEVKILEQKMEEIYDTVKKSIEQEVGHEIDGLAMGIDTGNWLID